MEEPVRWFLEEVLPELLSTDVARVQRCVAEHFTSDMTFQYPFFRVEGREAYARLFRLWAHVNSQSATLETFVIHRADATWQPQLQRLYVELEYGFWPVSWLGRRRERLLCVFTLRRDALAEGEGERWRVAGQEDYAGSDWMMAVLAPTEWLAEWVRRVVRLWLQFIGLGLQCLSTLVFFIHGQ